MGPHHNQLVVVKKTYLFWSCDDDSHRDIGLFYESIPQNESLGVLAAEMMASSLDDMIGAVLPLTGHMHTSGLGQLICNCQSADLAFYCPKLGFTDITIHVFSCHVVKILQIKDKADMVVNTFGPKTRCLTVMAVEIYLPH